MSLKKYKIKSLMLEYDKKDAEEVLINFVDGEVASMVKWEIEAIEILGFEDNNWMVY